MLYAWSIKKKPSMKYCRFYFKVDTKVIETEKATMEVPFKVYQELDFFMLMLPFF